MHTTSRLLVVAAALVGLSAACPGGTGADGGDEDGGAALRAVIAVIEQATLGARVELHGEGSVDPSGRAVLFAWTVAPPAGAACAGALEDDAAPVAVFVPSCVGTHTVTLVVSDAATATATFEVVLPAAPDVAAAVAGGAWRGFAASLDASATASAEPDLVYVWAVTTTSTDAACAGTLTDADQVKATFTPSCAVAYAATVSVSTPSGQSGAATVSFTARDPLVATFAPITAAPLGEGTVVVVHLAGLAAPDGAGIDVTLSASPTTTITPATVHVVHDGTNGEDATFMVAMATAHATYDLTAQASSGAVTGPAIQTSIVVANAAPTLTSARVESAFDVGEPFTLRAEIADADLDPVTCAAELLGGPTPLPVLSAGVVTGGSCVVQGQAPADVLGSWSIRLTASDDHGGSTAALIDVAPRDLAPIIDAAVPTSPTSYACAASGCTAAATVQVLAHDDIDAADAITFEFVPGDPNAPFPAGVTIVATPVLGSPGLYDVALQRADHGPMAGTYQIDVVAREATSLFDPPSSSTRRIVVVVPNAAPSVTAIVAPASIGHTYAGGRYRATFDVSFTPSDPEGNEVSGAVYVTSCPRGGAGEAACGGDLSLVRLVPTPGDGSLHLEIDAASILDVVGTWTFGFTATDVDGASGAANDEVIVGNTAPVYVGATGPIYQSRRADGSHGVTVDLAAEWSDADGDPLSMSDLVLRCPNAAFVDADTGSACSNGVAVARTGLTMTLSRNPGVGLLGAYLVRGSVADGVAVVTPPDHIWSHLVANRAPTITMTSPAVQTANHRVFANVLSNEVGEEFLFTGSVADADGDHVRVVMSPRVPWVADGEPTDAPPGAVAFTFTLSTVQADFIADPTSMVSVIVYDELDAMNAVPPEISVTFLNRAPTGVPQLTWTSTDPSVGGAAMQLPNTMLSTSSSTAAWNASPSSITIRLEIDGVTDPDGDDLWLDLGLAQCESALKYGGQPVTSQYIPLNGFPWATFQLVPTAVTCDSSTRYDVGVVLRGTPTPRWEHPFQCSGNIFISDSVDEIYDTMYDGSLAANPAGTAPVQCPL